MIRARSNVLSAVIMTTVLTTVFSASVAAQVRPPVGPGVANYVSVSHVENREHRFACVHAPDDELFAVGAPGSGGADELQAGEVRVQCRIDELAHDAPGRRFCEEEVD